MFTLVAVLLLGGVPETLVEGRSYNFGKRLADIESKQADFESRLAALEAANPLKAASFNQAVVVPAGQHAHQTTDGQTIVHADSNYGDPVAHQGIQWPWAKTATAGQAVSCPNGVCPNTQQAAARVTYSNRASYSEGSFAQPVRVTKSGKGGKRCRNGKCEL